MPKINLNSVSPSVFMVNAANDERADIVSKGRVLFYEHAANGKSAIMAANGLSSAGVQHMLTPKGYKELNEKFQREHLMYAAKICCAQTGEAAPLTLRTSSATVSVSMATLRSIASCRASIRRS